MANHEVTGILRREPDDRFRVEIEGVVPDELLNTIVLVGRKRVQRELALADADGVRIVAVVSMEKFVPKVERFRLAGGAPTKPTEPAPPVQPAPPQPAPSQASSEAAPELTPAVAASTHFIHPYNFVRTPAAGLSKEARIAPFHRVEPARHDAYDPSLRSGKIVCELTTETQTFIPDPRKVELNTINKHKTFGYFTLGKVTKWKSNVPDLSVPAIPAASLRGMIRTIFETVTLSCLSVFDPSRLDYRMGYAPDQEGSDVADPSRGPARYLPCRVVELDGEQAVIQFLDGRFESPDDDPVVLNAALLPAYKGKVRSGSGPESGWVPFQDQRVKDGTPVVASIDLKPLMDKRGRFRYRMASDVLVLPGKLAGEQQDDWIQRIVDTFPIGIRSKLNKIIIFGYLHRTGPNWREKKNERIFFDAKASYNDPACPDAAQPFQERLEAFLNDRGEFQAVPVEIYRECWKALREYSHRNGKRTAGDPPRAHTVSSTKAQPSDFVLTDEKEVRIRTGQLFYALVEGDEPGKRKIHGLYPVAIPRLSHENTRGDLLHQDFYPCSRRHEKCEACSCLPRPEGEWDFCPSCKAQPESLCATCRVFGWVRDLSYYKQPGSTGPKASSTRVDSIAGHVRFTHGIFTGVSWGRPHGPGAERITLSILSSPKPTTTGFYLDAEKTDWELKRETRWPPVTGKANERNPVSNLPVYRTVEARLAGRKMYRRRSIFVPVNQAGIRPTDQNRTVYAIPRQQSFKFQIHFDNLTPEEFGALLFAVSLKAPAAWGTESRSHAIGYGKPLGMGRCKVDVKELIVEGPERYSKASIQTTASSNAPTISESDLNAGMKPFFDAWKQIDQAPQLNRVRRQLIEMLTVVPPTEEISYPPVLIVDNKAKFEWWQKAKLNSIFLPDPIKERKDRDSRLPFDLTPP